MDNVQTYSHLEEVVDKLFALYAPGKTYQIVDDYPEYRTRVTPVLRLPDHHVSIFSSADAEYKFWTLVELHSEVTKHGPFVFRKIVEIALYNFPYSMDMSVTFAIMYALIVKQEEYLLEHKHLPINQRQFVEEYLNNG